jgi:hypothetical protein
MRLNGSSVIYCLLVIILFLGFSSDIATAKRSTTASEMKRIISSVSPIEQQSLLQAVVSLEDQRSSEQATASLMTNDPFFINQWFLKNIGQKANGLYGFAGADISIEPAWKIATGKKQTIAVIDTGLAYHPDLLNKRVGGYNFVSPGSSVDDNNNHGTIISGLVAAQANNRQGIAGIAYDSKIMPLKVSNGDSTDLDYLTQAINYLNKQKVTIANISFGSSGYTKSFQQAIVNNPQILFVVAAGNEGHNNQNIPTYPCSLPMENILCVAASTQNDRLARWSNYGHYDVDLVAPGENIISTGSSHPYLIGDGTSFSSPIVAASAALIQQANPDYTPIQIKQVILGSVDKFAYLSDKTVSGGRLNVWRALLENSSSVRPRLLVKRLRTANSSTAKFWLSSSQPKSKFECRIDNQKQWSGCSGKPLIIRGKYLRNGYHKVHLRTVNSYGQLSLPQSIKFFTSTVKPQIKRLTGQIISKQRNKFKVKIVIEVNGANQLWCARSGYPFRKCHPGDWRLYLKKGSNKLIVRASNKYNNFSQALFNLKVK